MAQAVTPSGDVKMLAFTCNIPANTLLHICDEEGNEAATFIAPKAYSCVVLANSNLKSGVAYQVYAEGTYSVTCDDGYLAGGEYTPGQLLGTLNP